MGLERRLDRLVSRVFGAMKVLLGATGMLPVSGWGGGSGGSRKRSRLPRPHSLAAATAPHLLHAAANAYLNVLLLSQEGDHPFLTVILVRETCCKARQYFSRQLKMWMGVFGIRRGHGGENDSSEGLGS